MEEFTGDQRFCYSSGWRLAGVLVLGAKVVNDVGSAHCIVHDLETPGAVVPFIIGAVGLTLAGGPSAARVNETRHAHKRPAAERQVIRETASWDGQHARASRRSLTVPGALDMYPSSLRRNSANSVRRQHDAGWRWRHPSASGEVVDRSDLPHQ